MHIGLIIYGSLETVSGGFLYDRLLVEHLQRCGDEVTVISLPWRNYGRHLTDNFSRSLFNQLRHANFDILLQDELNHPSLFWLNGRLRRHVSYPIISIVHHLRSSELRPRWQNSLYGWIERKYLRSVDGFVFNSKTTRESVIQGGWNGTKSHTTHHTPRHVIAYPAGDRLNMQLTANAIHKRALANKPLRLLFVGNWEQRKGLHVLLEALKTLPSSGWQLDVVGNTAVSSTYTNAILRQISQFNGQINQYHSPPDEELTELLIDSHVMVVPSSYEGFGIVYLEGMGAGLPAIGTHNGAAHEIIQHGKTGFLMEVGDTAVLAQRIQQLHQNRQLLAQMSQAAFNHFQTFPSWEQSMAKIRDFLLTVKKA